MVHSSTGSLFLTGIKQKMHILKSNLLLQEVFHVCESQVRRFKFKQGSTISFKYLAAFHEELQKACTNLVQVLNSVFYLYLLMIPRFILKLYVVMFFLYPTSEIDHT